MLSVAAAFSKQCAPGFASESHHVIEQGSRWPASAGNQCVTTILLALHHSCWQKSFHFWHHCGEKINFRWQDCWKWMSHSALELFAGLHCFYRLCSLCNFSPKQSSVNPLHSILHERPITLCKRCFWHSVCDESLTFNKCHSLSKHNVSFHSSNFEPKAQNVHAMCTWSLLAKSKQRQHCWSKMLRNPQMATQAGCCFLVLCNFPSSSLSMVDTILLVQQNRPHYPLSNHSCAVFVMKVTHVRHHSWKAKRSH